MPTVANQPPKQLLDASCERIIAKFEQAGHIEAIEFTRAALNSVEVSLRAALATELARIELERNFVRDYLHEVAWKTSQFYTVFPELLKSDFLRSELAFEHYRLSRLYGKPVTRQQIAGLYDTPGDAWKELPLGTLVNSLSSGEPAFPRVGEACCGYPLIAELGRGALARVYLARQTDLASRLVVLKITGRVTAEAEKLARLQHTNIVPVYSVHRSQSHGHLYAICMPYLGSLTLADLLILFEGKEHQSSRIEELISTLVARRRSTLINTSEDSSSSANSAGLNPAEMTSGELAAPASVESAAATELPRAELAVDDTTSVGPSARLDRQLGYDELMGALHSLVKRPNDVQSACQLIEGIASGMAYAHAIGIVHRDLKPENVLIANDGRPVVLDFNLSDEPASGRPEIVGGTLPYMSLQQLQSLDRQQRASPADDVFAIGTIFYRLLTGRLPYVTRSLDHLTQLIEERKSRPLAIRRLAPSVSPALSSIVMKCLARDEHARYPTAQELLEDLICFREHRTLRHADDRSLVERAQRFMRRHPVVTTTTFMVAVATALLLMVGSGWWWTTQRAKRMNQQLQLQKLIADMPEMISQLHGPVRDAPQLQRGVAEATQSLAQWDLSAQHNGAHQQLDLLSVEDRQRALQRLGQLTYALASAQGNLALLDAHAQSQQHSQQALLWNQVAAELAPQLAAACRFQRAQLQPQDGKADAINSLRADAEPADTPLSKLLLARQTGDIAGWVFWADVMCSDQPDDATAWFNLASAHYTAGRYERARGCFDVAAKLQAGSLSSIFWRGIASHQLGDYDRALKDFDLCVQQDASWVAARHNRALAEFALKQLDEAYTDASYLIDNHTAGPRVWLLRSQINRLHGREAQAASDRQSALSATCLSADDWVAVGVQSMAAAPQDALIAFDKARQLEPANLAALQNAAHLFSEQLQQTDKAIQAMDQLIALRPTEAGHYATRGILSARLNRQATALQDAEQAGGLRPKAIEMLQIAGIYSLLSSSSEPDKQSLYIGQSLDWLRRALAMEPNLARIVELDPDTVAIRAEPIYKEIMQSSKTLSKIN